MYKYVGKEYLKKCCQPQNSMYDRRYIDTVGFPHVMQQKLFFCFNKSIRSANLAYLASK